MSKSYRLVEAMNVSGCTVDRMDIAAYGNGKIAVQLYCKAEWGYEPFATLSVNLPEQAGKLDEGEFFAKTYSENAPIYAAMKAAGYIEECGGGGIAGHAGTVPICRLTSKATQSPL